MPLQDEPDINDYSENSSECTEKIEPDTQKSEADRFIDELFADFDFNVRAADDDGVTDEEILAALDDIDDDSTEATSTAGQAEPPPNVDAAHNDNQSAEVEQGAEWSKNVPKERSKNVSDRAYERSKNVPAAAKWSKNVPASRSKNVQRRKRRGTLKDAIIIDKIRRFDELCRSASSVGYPTPSTSSPNPTGSAHSTPSTSAIQSTSSHDNDNNIPVWDLTGDLIKVVAASLALLIAETRPEAFTFNLTPEAIESAKSDPDGFLDHLKRAFDRKVRQAFGYVFPYWFVVDIDEDKRLHLHGAFSPPNNSLPVLRKIRKAMKDAWGYWEGPGKNKQLRFEELYSDGWATYAMEEQAAVKKIIGRRTVTINQPLREDARWAYDETRRILRTG